MLPTDDGLVGEKRLLFKSILKMFVDSRFCNDLPTFLHDFVFFIFRYHNVGTRSSAKPASNCRTNFLSVRRGIHSSGNPREKQGWNFYYYFFFLIINNIIIVIYFIIVIK